MIDKTQILINAERHVCEMIRLQLPKARTFHGLKHTQSVALKCHELSTFYNVASGEKMLLHLAAWFHDVGYCVNSEDHESHSVQAMRNYLHPYFPESQLIQIQNIIVATKQTARPEGKLEKMMCDADMHHLGSSHYEKWSALLKQEVEHYNHISITDEDWIRENISFFLNHSFFTGFANHHWRPLKESNLLTMKERLKVSAV